MVLKLVRTEKYDIEEELSKYNINEEKLEKAKKETENYVNPIITDEISYRGNIKNINCSYPLNSKDTFQVLRIYYKDGSEENLVIGEYNKEIDEYEPVYRFIYLMNDEGKTIERII